MTPYRPDDPFDISALAESLSDLPLGLGEDERTRAGSDYHWYSPVLAQRLKGCRPDLVVRARSQADVMRVAAACVRHRVPLTVRGGGTGNYGQCVPLHGGVSLDMTGMHRVLAIEAGWAHVEAGVLMHELNRQARLHPLHGGQQLRMWPSTERIATLGGFIAGGHSGIGSIRHGVLADAGNVRRLRIVSMEAAPRVLDLEGADIQKAHHAYGSNGIIVEVEVALTARVPWRHTITLFDSYEALLQFGLAVGAAALRDPRDIDVFQLSAVERRITPYYVGMRGTLRDADAMFAQVSPQTLPRYGELAQRMGGRLVVHGAEAELLSRGLPSAAECAYHHTTLEALKSDAGVTYLQLAYAAPVGADFPALVARQMQRLGDEVFMHHEFIRSGGELMAFALPLVQYFDEAQLRELSRGFEADGCRVFNPHTWVLEDGGMKQFDQRQLDFKRQADPMGLMNPGKVRSWDEAVLGMTVGRH